MSIMVWGNRGHRHHRYADMFPPGQPYENSLHAFEDTLGICMGVETDVIQSRDGLLLLAHDTLFSDMVHYELKIHLDDKSKALIGDRYIYQVPDADAMKLHLKDGQYLMQLRVLLALMRQYPGRVVNFELKGPNTVDATVRLVERAIQENVIKPEQVVFTSFNLPALRDLRVNVGHRFKIGAIFARADLPLSPMYPSWPNAPQDAYYVPFNMADNFLDRGDLRDIAPDYFSVEGSCITAATIDTISEKYPRAKFIMWTAAERHPDADTSVLDTVERYARSGKIHAVMSDFPGLIQARLIERGVAVTLPA